MEYTDSQREDNYMRIVCAIRDIRNGRRITEDWMYEQMKFIQECRDFYPDMSKLNPEVTTPRWRAMAENCEMILSQLMYEIHEMCSFSVQLYLTFCEHIKQMFEMTMSEDDITDLLSKMTM